MKYRLVLVHARLLHWRFHRYIMLTNVFFPRLMIKREQHSMEKSTRVGARGRWKWEGVKWNYKTESCFHHWRKINDRQERASTDSVYLQRCKSHRCNFPSPISFSGESRVQNRPARRPCCHGFISFVQSPTPITCTHTERNPLFRYFPLFFDVKKARKKWKLPSNPPKNWFTFFFLPFLFYFRFVETR